METDYLDNVSSSSEDDDEEIYTDSCSDELNSDCEMRQKQDGSKKLAAAMETTDVQAHNGPNNIVLKLSNKECFGNIRGHSRYAHHVKQDLFSKVPNRLHCRLKNILPPFNSAGHIFMGLTACGQFLLSYKMIPKENVPYSFNMGFMYSLYFWVYQPHKRLNEFYKCCLFDDHGVDNIKEVTITQWKNCDPRILVVHGASSDEGEDSYITYVKVPKLGCLDCKNLRESDQLDSFLSQFNPLCLNCNLTIHTKYPFVEADRKFDPFTNLICPNRILLVANGFMHMLKIEVENNVVNPPTASPNANCYMQLSSTASNQHLMLTLKSPQQFSSQSQIERRQSQLSTSNDDITMSYDNCNNVVARIQADFSDIETASTTSNDSRHNDYTKYQISTTCSPAPPTNYVVPNNESQQYSSRGAMLTSPHLKHKPRIVTKSFRNGVITVDMQGLPSTSTGSGSNPNDKSSAYDFSEDNEKCEKIATLRKRRLADKKYEFSEDNSENIVPFTKVRSANRSFGANCFGGSPTSRALHRATTTANTFHKSPCASPSSSPHTSFESRLYAQATTLPNAQCVSPITTNIPQGFRSPQSCGSPVSVANFIRSPKRQSTAVGQIPNQKSPPVAATASSSLTLSAHAQQLLSFKPLGALSPLQVSSTKCNQLEMSGMSPNAHIVEIPTQPGQVPEKPVCTKKLQRRYIEEDDAASVITSEEDDCISPGYHTSLPMEVHGSWYSEMHMISQASYQQLRCPSVIITQHSFDFETFTYYAISILCQKNQKTYDVFYDWAYDVISVCPVSNTVFCVLLAQFSARDQLPSAQTICLNCSHKLDCAFHRHYYESRILFTWQMETAEWDVLDYGELKECKNAGVFTVTKRCNQKQPTLIQQAKKIVKEMSTSLKKLLPHYADNLRVLDSNVKKSKTALSDLDNMVEFHLRKPRSD